MSVDFSTHLIIIIQEHATIWDTITQFVVNTTPELRYDPEWDGLARSVLESAQMRECLPLHDTEGRRKRSKPDSGPTP